MERNLEIEQGIDIADLERNLENIQSQLKETIENIEILNEKYKEEEQKMEPITLQLEEKNKEANEISKETDKYQKELEKILRNKEKISKGKSDSSTKYNALFDTKNDLVNKCKDIDLILIEDTKKAQLVCDRVPVDATTRNIITNLTTLEKRVQEEQKKKKKSSEEISEEYYEANKLFQTTNNSIKAISKTREMLDKALVQRTKYWIYMRKKIAKIVKYYFNMNLSNQGHSGNIQFDFDNESLDIQVQLEKTKSVHKDIVQKTTELSGGEGSFTTVSLLLSLWETMDTPFSAMDEFDVFMDAINRRISIDLMIKSARLKKDRQFIFITPHDLSFVTSSNDIKIIRMNPPERGQTTITNYIGN